jgi:hypothetical protein
LRAVQIDLVWEILGSPSQIQEYLRQIHREIQEGSMEDLGLLGRYKDICNERFTEDTYSR